MNGMNTDIKTLAIDEITVKNPARADVGDLSTLESSIRKLGLLSPVIVNQRHVLISGGRRLEACRRAGLSAIPAVVMVVSTSPSEAIAFAIPKSITFTWPRGVIMMLDGLISRWTIPTS